MFKRISYWIALQFTIFVLGLFLLNGIIFLAADLTNARRQTHFRLSRDSFVVVGHIDDPRFPEMHPEDLPLPMRDRVRFVDASGSILYAGRYFSGVPFRPQRGLSRMHIEDDDMSVLTVPVMSGGMLKAYAQIADMERLRLNDLPLRAFLYLIVSLSVSALTFIIGIFFARRSLKPAEEMMKRLEQFTQDASHELRTPLAALSSSLDLALKTKKYQEGISSAKDDIKDITALVERLLELARIDKFVLGDERIDFTALVEDTLEKYRPIAKDKNITVHVTLVPHITVRGDAALLRQVISNLFTNAVKFNKPSGTITIVLTKKELSIADTGIGIAPQDLPNIFHRFFQADTSRAKDGYGLGLALTKRIVDVHGWSMRAESTLGRGTTFRIALQTA